MESDNKHYKNNGMGEGDPGNINPNDKDNVHPAKTISEREDLEIKESGLGRDQGQTPADEHIENFSQIQDDTGRDGGSMKQTVDKQFDTSDENRVDERDNNDSSEDWDAEKSSTGRQK